MKNGPYILVKAPKDYPGKKYRDKYIYEHQLVWWKKTGKLVPKGYEIHHKDENKTRNVFSNLELKTKSAHTAEHNTKEKISVKCFKCEKKFKIRKLRYDRKTKRGFRFFCSKDCVEKTLYIKGIIKLNCNWCNKKFEKKKADYDCLRKRGQRNFYCSLSHQAKHRHAMNRNN